MNRAAPEKRTRKDMPCLYTMSPLDIFSLSAVDSHRMHITASTLTDRRHPHLSALERTKVAYSEKGQSAALLRSREFYPKRGIDMRDLHGEAVCHLL